MTHEVNLATLGRLLGVVDVVSVSPGNFLFREGDDAAALYIVRSGVLQIIGDDVIYETITAGGVVGELAIADEGKRSASVLASTHAELWAVDTPGFLALVKADPEFALTIMRVMTRRLRTMNLRYRMAAHNDQLSPKAARPLVIGPLRKANQSRLLRSDVRRDGTRTQDHQKNETMPSP